jgi:hypothetical protein
MNAEILSFQPHRRHSLALENRAMSVLVGVGSGPYMRNWSRCPVQAFSSFSLPHLHKHLIWLRSLPAGSPLSPTTWTD